MELKHAIGLTSAHLNPDEERLRRRHFLNINLTLAAAGQSICEQVAGLSAQISAAGKAASGTGNMKSR